MFYCTCMVDGFLIILVVVSGVQTKQKVPFSICCFLLLISYLRAIGTFWYNVNKACYF